jgi:hypothetical protein
MRGGGVSRGIAGVAERTGAGVAARGAGLGSAGAADLPVGRPGIAPTAPAGCGCADCPDGAVGATATSAVGLTGFVFTSGAGGRNWIQK